MTAFPSLVSPHRLHIALLKQKLHFTSLLKALGLWLKVKFLDRNPYLPIGYCPCHPEPFPCSYQHTFLDLECPIPLLLGRLFHHRSQASPGPGAALTLIFTGPELEHDARHMWVKTEPRRPREHFFGFARSLNPVQTMCDKYQLLTESIFFYLVQSSNII